MPKKRAASPGAAGSSVTAGSALVTESARFSRNCASPLATAEAGIVTVSVTVSQPRAGSRATRIAWRTRAGAATVGAPAWAASAEATAAPATKASAAAATSRLTSGCPRAASAGRPACRTSPAGSRREAAPAARPASARAGRRRRHVEGALELDGLGFLRRRAAQVRGQRELLAVAHHLVDDGVAPALLRHHPVARLLVGDRDAVHRHELVVELEARGGRRRALGDHDHVVPLARLRLRRRDAEARVERVGRAREAPDEVRIGGLDRLEQRVLVVGHRHRDHRGRLPLEPQLHLPLGAEAVGDVAGADQHDHDRLLAAVLLQRLQRVPPHGRVPRALRAVHALEHRVRHVAVERVRGAEERPEELLVLGAVGVDARRQHGLLLRREGLVALRPHRLHDRPRHVHPEHPDPALAREEEDVAVVVPVVAPVLVPVGLLQERLLGEGLVGVPPVEPLLLGHRVHLEADEDLAAALVKLLDDAQLDLVELDVGVALADEQDLDAVEARGELGRRHHVAGGGVGDPVHDDRRLPVLARGVADREVGGAVVGAKHRSGGEEQGRSGEGSCHGASVSQACSRGSSSSAGDVATASDSPSRRRRRRRRSFSSRRLDASCASSRSSL